MGGEPRGAGQKHEVIFPTGNSLRAGLPLQQPQPPAHLAPPGRDRGCSRGRSPPRSPSGPGTLRRGPRAPLAVSLHGGTAARRVSSIRATAFECFVIYICASRALTVYKYGTKRARLGAHVQAVRGHRHSTMRVPCTAGGGPAPAAGTGQGPQEMPRSYLLSAALSFHLPGGGGGNLNISQGDLSAGARESVRLHRVGHGLRPTAPG